MRMSLRKNGLTFLFKEVKVFKVIKGVDLNAKTAHNEHHGLNGLFCHLSGPLFVPISRSPEAGHNKSRFRKRGRRNGVASDFFLFFSVFFPFFPFPF